MVKAPHVPQLLSVYLNVFFALSPIQIQGTQHIVQTQDTTIGAWDFFFVFFLIFRKSNRVWFA